MFFIFNGSLKPGDDISTVDPLLVEGSAAGDHFAVIEHGQVGGNCCGAQVNCQTEGDFAFLPVPDAAFEDLIGIHHNRRQYDPAFPLDLCPACQARPSSLTNW